MDGTIIMNQLAQWSGNSSSPQAYNVLLQEKMNRSNYVRLYSSLGLNGGNNLPTLWAFLLIVLAIVLLIIGLTSLSMHCYQRRNRRALERRIRSGEVDLETLGIKRLRVPQSTIKSLHTFVLDAPVNPISNAPLDSVAPAPSATDLNPFGQVMCSFCLEDFVPHETTVRSLPCRHIYHPQCIDQFLLDSSSLCPLCKARVVPHEQNAHIHEPVTNAMVRYERRARRLRLAREARQAQTGPSQTQTRESLGRFPNLRRVCGRDRRSFSAPDAAPITSQIEMTHVGSGAVSSTPTTIPNAEDSTVQIRPPIDPDLRREWMSRRMSMLAGRERTLEEAEAEREARMPGCKFSRLPYQTSRQVADTNFQGERSLVLSSLVFDNFPSGSGYVGTCCIYGDLVICHSVIFFCCDAPFERGVYGMDVARYNVLARRRGENNFFSKHGDEGILSIHIGTCLRVFGGRWMYHLATSLYIGTYGKRFHFSIHTFISSFKVTDLLPYICLSCSILQLRHYLPTYRSHAI